MFHIDVEMVVFGCCTCCNGYKHMLQEFVQNVSSISDTCCRCFIYVLMLQWLCCIYKFKMFHLFQAYVAIVSSECCKSRFRCRVVERGRESYRRSHDDVDVGRRRRAHAPVWKRQGSHPSGMEEVGAKQCGRDGRGIGVEETGPSHPCNMGSGAKGSGPNAGARSGVGMSGARIRETRVEQAWASGLAQCPGASLSGPIR
jgi:hypothetical protein